MWHMIEINSSESVTVKNCIFDGPTYTVIPENLYNEQIQLDLSRDGSYGPVYNCDGTLIDFCKDDTVCRNITIADNLFKCAGFPAIGHHGDCTHNNVLIENNIFDGPSGLYGISRGYISFRSETYGIRVKNNVFITSEDDGSPSLGIVFDNPDKGLLITEGNVFIGKTGE